MGPLRNARPAQDSKHLPLRPKNTSRAAPPLRGRHATGSGPRRPRLAAVWPPFPLPFPFPFPLPDEPEEELDEETGIDPSFRFS